MRVLELFAGIGGCAAALADRARVVCAVDQNPYAAQVYRANFEHRYERWNLGFTPAKRLRALDADLWWMSPPCQPFTVRGHRRDLDDPRCGPLLALTRTIAEVRPRHVALENVPGFGQSRMRAHLLEALQGAGYRWRERELCPTALGIPMRRRRYYLVASLDPLRDWLPVRPHRVRVEQYAIRPVPPELYVGPELLERYAGKLPISDPVHAPWVGVFTSAYGRSPVYAGSYWRDEVGIRHFSPQEGLRFLGFPSAYRLPTELGFQRRWRLVGNSLSVDAVREVLRIVAQPM